ncbi:MAG: histidine phosphatase family protein [Acetatifactor sp.]
MIVYLMRHGETDWNKERRLQGRSDIPLNAFGMELAEKTAEGMKEIPFDRAFSSPLDRAYTTARIVIGDRPVEVVKDDRLQEICFGPSEGQCFDRAKQDPTHSLHNFFCHPGEYHPVDGAESFAEARARAKEFFDECIFPLEGTCENVLVVAHGALNRSILNAIAGIPDSDFWRISLANCAVSILKVENGKLSILEEQKVYYGGEPVNGRP